MEINTAIPSTTLLPYHPYHHPTISISQSTLQWDGPCVPVLSKHLSWLQSWSGPSLLMLIVCWTASSQSSSTTSHTTHSISHVQRKALHAQQLQQQRHSRQLMEFQQAFVKTHPHYHQQLLHPPQDAPMKTHNNTPSTSSSCRVFQVLLTHEDSKKHIHSSFETPQEIQFGSLQGGTIPLRSSASDNNTNDTNTIIGSYTFLNTFLGPVTNLQTMQVDCFGAGTYTFFQNDNNNHSKNNNEDTTSTDSISFAASCEHLPYLTITGGQGRYTNATGYIQYRIPDPRGWLHEVHVCA